MKKGVRMYVYGKMDFKKYYADRKQLVKNFLEKRTARKGISKVDDAMIYSLLAGGKRIRPILLMATADAIGAKGYNFLPVACGAFVSESSASSPFSAASSFTPRMCTVSS